MHGKNGTPFKNFAKALALAAGMLVPSAAWASLPDAGYLGMLQYGFGAPIAAAVTSTIEAWHNGTIAMPRITPPQAVKVASISARPKAVSGQAATAVFQSVAFRVSSIPAAQKWKAVFPHVAAADFKRCETASECESAEILRKAVRNAADAGFHQKLNGINRTVNWLIRYESDARNYGSKDHWASPREILRRGKGDCEDYAILKMAALKELGLPAQSMSIVVLRDTRRNLYHAVLSVMTSQGYFILDNLSNEVRLDGALPDYQPLFSVSADRTWIHGIMSGGDRIASAAPPLLDVMPGEGALR